MARTWNVTGLYKAQRDRQPKRAARSKYSSLSGLIPRPKCRCFACTWVGGGMIGACLRIRILQRKADEAERRSRT